MIHTSCCHNVPMSLSTLFDSSCWSLLQSYAKLHKGKDEKPAVSSSQWQACQGAALPSLLALSRAIRSKETPLLAALSAFDRAQADKVCRPAFCMLFCCNRKPSRTCMHAVQSEDFSSVFSVSS